MAKPNSVSGRIFSKSGGIGNLIVEVYTKDLHQIIDPQGGLVRLAMAVTDSAGNFSVSFEDMPWRGEEEGGGSGQGGPQGGGPMPNVGRRWVNLVLQIKTPERVGENEPILIYESTKPRELAERDARYLIEVPEEKLKEFGIEVPVDNTVPKDPAKVEQTRKEYQEKVNQVYRTRFQNEKEKVKGFEAAFRKSISKVKEGDRDYIKEEDDLEEKQKEVFQETIENINNQSVNAEGVILLTVEHKEILQPFLSEDGSRYLNVPAYLIDPILYPSTDEKKKPTFLLRNNPTAELCRQKTFEEKCSEEFLDPTGQNENEEDSSNSNGEENESISSDDIAEYVGNLIRFQSSPEEQVYFGEAVSSSRPNQEDVQQSINSFILEKGPADSVAYYDFHNIQIAFRHIWMEAIDNGLLDLATSVYSELVTLTGIPEDMTTFLQSGTRQMKLLYETYSNANKEYADPVVVANFDITQEQWNILPQPLQVKLTGIAKRLDSGRIISGGKVTVELTSHAIFRLQQQGRRIINFVEKGNFKSLHKMLQELHNRLQEKYAFTVFPVKKDGKRSINFGIVVTYRQKWEPLNYQVGELVKTITLAPKEERKFTHKTVVKRKRSEKEAEKRSSSLREEMNTTSRAEAEIVTKAMAKTNFNLTANGSYNLGISSGSHKTSFSRNAQQDSQETKKDFREAVRKASQEYKSERSIEVGTEDVFESEFSESGTISNPNDELAVTYLFYELQRRYRVSEEIHRLTPVIFVAQEVPAPHEITDHWLIAHDWILRRVILDDSFVPALNYLSSNVVGDEFALRELKKNLDLQRTLVEELKQETIELNEQVGSRYEALERAIADRINVEEIEESDSFFRDIGEFFGGNNESPEAAKAREQATENAHEHVVRQSKEMAANLQREITSLNALSDKYTKLLSQHLNRKTQIQRLQVHIKDNILYYMQAIWSHEPPDQRFFRLATNVKAPHFEVAEKSYNIDTAIAQNVWTDPIDETQTPHEFELNTNLNDLDSQLSFKQLIEVADVDNLLGFKGNYMIFPLKVPNALTEWMMAPYVDAAFGLRDPDEFGNMNLRDFSKYTCCLHKEMTEEQFDAIRPVLKEYYKFLLTSPLRAGEDIIVPTDSLFIEALPAKHALLEDFKLMHRAIDVKKVQAEVREMELDNLRVASRILQNDLEDPDVEKKIVVQGNEVQAGIDVEG